MIWFKLVGATDKPVPPNWGDERSDLFTEVHFPWNKPPTDVSNGERIILYAVGSRVLIATQTVDGPPTIAPRRGPVGSDEYRWPHSIAVKTHYYCSPIDSAPKLREVAPDFDERYKNNFREGSHWRITEAEYEKLAAEIEAAGRPFQS
jgi:hypothetical protein